MKKPFFAKYQIPWQWPAEVPQTADWKRTEFASETGATLVGLFRQTTAPQRKGVIVCAHPMGSQAKAFYLIHGHAAMLLEHGYDVLLFDFNGFGESSNGNFDYPLDVLAAGRHAQALTGATFVGLLGISFGAAWGLCAVARPDHLFRAIVVEGAFTTLAEFWYRYRFPYLVLQTISAFMPRLASRIKPIDQVQQAKFVNQILLIYGERDKLTPISMGERFAQASAVPTTLWKIPDAKHTYGYMTARETYTAMVTAHFNQHLQE